MLHRDRLNITLMLFARKSRSVEGTRNKMAIYKNNKSFREERHWFLSEFSSLYSFQGIIFNI